MTDLKQLAAITALNEMMAGSHFNVCTIDRIGKMLDINPKGEAYEVLHTLHCINWEKMPKQLREAVPGLIKECLGVGPVFQFKTLEPVVIDVEPEKKRGFLRLLGGKS
jgi:hypothetical protein